MDLWECQHSSHVNTVETLEQTLKQPYQKNNHDKGLVNCKGIFYFIVRSATLLRVTGLM